MQAVAMNRNLKNSNLQMFASFRLGSSELAISISSLQEVVNYPDKITTVPLAPHYLVGMFNLRGVVTPIVDVALLLGVESEKSTVFKKVAIIATDKVRIGLLFDSTSEILNVAEENVAAFEKPASGNKQVIRSVLKLNGGDRLVEVIDPMSLVKIENLPEIIEQTKSNVVGISKKNSKRLQCITFRSGAMEFGLQISAIREIIRVPEIKRSVLAVDYCIGMVNLRGVIIPILDFQKFLKIEGEDSSDMESKRIVIMTFEKVQIGMLVNSVNSIVSFFEDEILPIPLFAQEKIEMMRGLLPDQKDDQKSGSAILLNESKILTNDEVVEITRGHSTLYGKKEDSAQSRQEQAGQRNAYLTFKLNYSLSTRLSAIDEIAKINEDLVQPPGYPKYVVGMMKMRGEVVTVVDLRAFYGMPVANDLQNSRMLIIKGQNGKFGLLVDSVESIDTVDETKKTKLPTILAKDVASDLQGHMKDIMEMTDLTGHKKTFMILDISELLQNLEGPSQ